MSILRSRELTVERLKEVLRYNKRTGIFTRLIALKKNLIGQPAGYSHGDGYIAISVDGKKYLAHRLAWFYITNKWPPNEIDHKNRNRSDNRWSNLRLATHSQNQANSPARNTNFLGIKGVRLHWTGKFEARYKQKHLGHFKTAELAQLAYHEAVKKEHGDFAMQRDTTLS